MTLNAPVGSPPEVQRRVRDAVQAATGSEYVVAWLERFVREDGRPCDYTLDIDQAKRFTRDEASRLVKRLEAQGCFGVRYGRLKT